MKTSLIGPIMNFAATVPAVLAASTSVLFAAQTRGDGTDHVFASPQDVVDASRRAAAKKDWRAWFRYRSPELRGGYLVELLAGAGMAQDPEIMAIIEKHCKGGYAEIAEVFRAVTKGVERDISSAQDCRLFYELLNKRIVDLPGFVDDCFRRLDEMGTCPLDEVVEVKDIKIKGDRAMGYAIPIPGRYPNVRGTSDPPVARGPWPPMPPTPVYFRKIDRSWYFALPDRDRK